MKMTFFHLSLCLFFLFNFNSSQQKPVLNILDSFFDSGYIGCSDNIHVRKNYKADSLHQHCYKYTVSVCDSLYAGVKWQYPANNWCGKPGPDLSKHGFTKITFAVKGETGKEVFEFMAGTTECGSFSTLKRKIYLTKEWQYIEILLRGKKLTDVVSPFTWLIDFKSHAFGDVTFYLDSLQFE